MLNMAEWGSDDIFCRHYQYLNRLLLV